MHSTLPIVPLLWHHQEVHLKCHLKVLFKVLLKLIFKCYNCWGKRHSSGVRPCMCKDPNLITNIKCNLQIQWTPEFSVTLSLIGPLPAVILWLQALLGQIEPSSPFYCCGHLQASEHFVGATPQHFASTPKDWT